MMGQQTLKAAISAITFTLAAFVPCLVAQAPTLQEQLTAQYKIVKMGSDTSGYSVVEPGTLLAIQKGGILAVPYSDQSILTTKYEGGSVKSPNALLTKGLGFGMKKFGKEQTTHLFQVGDKVYPSKIDVNVAGDKVSMLIIACDTCNKTDPPTYNKAQVVFQFPKGSLAKAGAGEVEDTIGQLLSISDDAQQAGGDQGGGQQGEGQQGGGQQGGQGQQAEQNQQPQPQAEPQSIEKGMTTEQVEGAMGKPEKIVNLGPKKIYVYKDLKVTFLNGKVFDVQ
ncbi:MAG TPA: hypothetical protein VN911_01265 [Candidatus Acidoferrum sp.]|jgi:hypothetical protein|nr:hypothetical protein [Candidatus Acidoferrum sp.]